MIQIISGVYGDGMKRAGDGPFCLSEQEEARLVKRGVAKYVDVSTLDPIIYDVPTGGTAPDPEQQGDAPGNDENGAPIGFDETPPELPELPEGVTAIPEYSVDSSLSDLRKIAALCGLTFKVGMTKADMVAMLDAHIAENTDESYGEGEEDAPTFDAADAVVE